MQSSILQQRFFIGKIAVFHSGESDIEIVFDDLTRRFDFGENG